MKKTDYKKRLQDAKPYEVQAICDEMMSKEIELEDVADEEKDKEIYNKVAMFWRPGGAI